MRKIDDLVMPKSLFDGGPRPVGLMDSAKNRRSRHAEITIRRGARGQ